MSAHTPGPWHSALVSEKTRNTGVYDESGFQVALVKVTSALSAQRRDADARLIAAAPDLLAALQAVIDGDSWTNLSCGPGSTQERARAAIAKAIGSNP